MVGFHGAGHHPVTAAILHNIAKSRERVVEALHLQFFRDHHVVDPAAGPSRPYLRPGRRTHANRGWSTNRGRIVGSHPIGRRPYHCRTTARRRYGPAYARSSSTARQAGEQPPCPNHTASPFSLGRHRRYCGCFLNRPCMRPGGGARLISPSSIQNFHSVRRHQHFGVRKMPACHRLPSRPFTWSPWKCEITTISTALGSKAGRGQVCPANWGRRRPCCSPSPPDHCQCRSPPACRLC